MCRLFGFRSVFKNRVHSSLVHADNALGNLSKKHTDGWGVAYYIDNVPHLIKSEAKAFEDQIFHKVSGVVSSENVVAHIRLATAGTPSILNSHPFQYGRWIFAHNGNIKNFTEKKKELISLIEPEHLKHVLGNTDSEIIFHIILSQFKKDNILNSEQTSLENYTTSIQKAMNSITKITKELTDSDDAQPTENYITFILTNGAMFFALQGGQPLYYSTHKFSCPERNSCQYFNASCESSSKNEEKVNHLIICSEPLKGDNSWSKMKFGEMVSIDESLKFTKKRLKIPLKRL